MEENPYGGTRGQPRSRPSEEKEPWISGLGEDYNMFMDRFLQGELVVQRGGGQLLLTCSHRPITSCCYTIPSP